MAATADYFLSAKKDAALDRVALVEAQPGSPKEK
jgi:hypothetical protein